MNIETNVLDRVEQQKINEPDPVAGIFDGDCGWTFPSSERCKRKKLSPNLLAFCKATATLTSIVKRSPSGQDFALSEAGLEYFETTLATCAKAFLNASCWSGPDPRRDYGQRSCEPHKKAEHMAAPTNAAKREKSSCQPGAVHT